MIRKINKDIAILQRKSLPAARSDIPYGNDLRDTLEANKEYCVGMAANMIGINKNIIAIMLMNRIVVMYNPRIISKAEPYKCMEGCLSLNGQRETTRYMMIVVEYEDESFMKHKLRLSGFSAEIVQHECDHLKGIVI